MPRVLIVDDNPTFRYQLAMLLRRAGAAEIIEAEDIPQALRLAESRPPTLAIVDVLLPGLNGLEGARLLLKRFPGLRLVVVSAYPQFRTAAARVGALDFCAKDALDLQTVRRWLAQGATPPAISPTEGGKP